MTEVEQQPPPQNGIDLSAAEEDDSSKARPADIEQDMREMERRKRVEAIMGSKLFREELERIVDSARDGGGILQQLSDIMGVPTSTRVGNVFKATNCMLPINDIRGVESMGYAKGEKILRCKLAATFRLLDLYGWTQGLGAQITARLKVDQENFLVNPYGMMYHEITASSLNRVDMQGQIVEQGTTNFGVNKNHFALHSVVHAARPDIRCAIYIGCTPVVAVSSLKVGLLPLTRDACVLGEITTHSYTGTQMDADERDRLVRALGPNSKVLILSNYGALCCGETIEEAFFAASHIVKACETQLQLLPVGVDNLVLIPEESRKAIFADARRPPEDLEKKFAAAVATVEANAAEAAGAADGAADGSGAIAVKAAVAGGAPKWRVGGAEFEALMRMLDNAGYRTGYIYRHPLIKSDPPKPKNDVELPPAVSSLGYLLEEEELLKQGIWKKGDLRKGGDRSRWLNSPNVYQKVEVLETGTPDPKKITKWVAEGSPTHSTPVRIEDPLQFVPAGTNPKEFKRLQQQIKDNRRADKISAGPQSHILEGVTWDEANRIKDATVSSAGDHVVLMGAASKGIIQRGYQHNAAVYKAPYAKNPFDNVTDDELNEYKRTVERKKKSIHGEYTDTDFSESEPLSSMPISAPQQTKQLTITTAAVSQSEPEDVSEHQVMRIETKQAPVPSQPELVLSDDLDEAVKYSEEEDYSSSPIYENIVEKSNAHKSSIANYNNNVNNSSNNINNQCLLHTHAINEANDILDLPKQQQAHQSNKENIYCGNTNIKRNTALIAELKKDAQFQRQKHKLQSKECMVRQGRNYNCRSTLLKCSGSEKSPGRVGDSDGESAVGSQNIESSGGNIQQQRINVESIGFRPIHPIEPRADASETFTQQPQFCYADSNNNVRGDGGGCHHHCQIYHQRQRQHTGPAVGIVTLPHFEQAFGHLLGRPATTDFCGIYYDNYPPDYESIYDRPQYVEPVNTGSVVTTTSDIDEAENPYKKANDCCTPAVCDSVFEALRKPAANDNNLILNIPFTAESPDTTNTTMSTPRKTRADSPHKTDGTSNGCGNGVAGKHPVAHSPYRTLSHFGFNSPQRHPQPEHKHIPSATETKKYVPLRKSISYEEIFSSPRYVDLCENCFEKIVRLKPEIAQQTQMRLRNLYDFNGASAVAGRARAATCPGIMYQPATDGVSYDYVEYASSDTTEEILPLFSSQLEPVLEVVEEVEPESLEDANITKKVAATAAQNLYRTPSNSSFIEKIMRLNYSEESADWDFAHAPHKIASSTNLTLELERAIRQNSQRDQQQDDEKRKDVEAAAIGTETKHYNTDMESELEPQNNENALTMCVNVENEGATHSPQRLSVTEIWEFMHWQDEARASHQQLQSDHEVAQPFSQNDGVNIPHKGSICLYYENAREGTSNKNRASGGTGAPRDNTKSQEDHGNQSHRSASASRSAEASDESVRQERRRSLMTREERSRRKLVFQELWEDHIFFLDGKETNTLSDTESAIDGQQEQQSTADADGVATESSETCTSATVEQDVTNELNVGNELLLMRTEEGNARSSVVPSTTTTTTLQSNEPQVVDAEVFHTRSVILNNCSSNAAMRTSCNECGDDFDKITTKSETLMKLQQTEVRHFSINEPACTHKECEASTFQTSVMEGSNPAEDATPFYHEVISQAHGERGSSSATLQMSASKRRFEKSENPTTPVNRSSATRPLDKEMSELFSKSNDLNSSPSPNRAFLPTSSLKTSLERQKPEPKSTEVLTESKLFSYQANITLTKSDHEKRSIPAAITHNTKSLGKSVVVAHPIPYTVEHTIANPLPIQPHAQKSSPKPAQRFETDRPPTPKPPITKTNFRKLSTPEPQTTIPEYDPKMAASLHASLGEESTSESDDDQSARTYNVDAASQECLFFREHQLANAATDAATGRTDSEDDEICLATIGRNVDGVQFMETKVASVQEVVDIVLNELKSPPIERARAGMALPTDDEKPKSEHTNTNVTHIAPNVARVAQLAAEALKEPSTTVYAAAPRILKRPRRRTNVLAKSNSNVASTSGQAAQRKAAELELAYKPKFEEYVLFKQNIPSPSISMRAHLATECDRDVEDTSALALDKDEMEFAELLESEEHIDLTRLSEEFEELLLNVENLQLQPQARELGGAETYAAADEREDSNNVVAEAESHFNAMERKILRKIRENQLNESEEIFDKIEMTIRNKITPNQLELQIKEQSSLTKLDQTQVTLAKSQSSQSTITASTPERHSAIAHSSFGVSFLRERDAFETDMAEPDANLSDADADESSTLTPHGTRYCSRGSEDFNTTQADFSAILTSSSCSANLKLRRSRSLTPSTGNCELSPPPPKLNKTTTPPQEMRKSLSAHDSQSNLTAAACKSKSGTCASAIRPRDSSSTPEIKSAKRNFILENIRNAAIPRHSGVSGGGGGSGSVKRLQGNAHAIFCKNPFGPVTNSTSGNSKMLLSNMSTSSLTSSTTSSNRTVGNSKQLSPRNSSTGVYTFQSKLVRGSPRFWVSLTQPTAAKKLQTQKRRRRSQQQQQYHHHRSMQIEAHDSTGSLRDFSDLMDNEQSEEPEAEGEMMGDEEQASVLNEEQRSMGANEEAVEIVNLDIVESQEISDGLDIANRLSDDVAGGGSVVDGGVEQELVALDEQIQKIQPRLDNYKCKMRDFGDHLAKCTRHMDDCIAVQGDIVEEQRQLREQMALQQYVEHIVCQVQTYSISETED
ncbi:uncharacterized protein LOC118744952 isoform X1 [Rhagoletis pomonella]|uniref:uncharacterized protein LOC118744952 isoform X1 n=1 Tax=Rhagoletis pomonella TaxID=28610 RepID=UPI001781EC72|nr:uncharacterized protein LOC118744952 isoform X1 [Rhagoletis pomonella]XP_036334294.1 uncharacterized protein LOC118744952 isoform X1 [Rhagoletis pomonella]XP_036334295.1 uncharacterized protein LOC118744952 isoform X1 [Rhagoletis pomonella]XP_036334296.1 uncharacterized protein LOC118744952 isoform X1 [Rhagoletis pomonella]XP_036334297.1 uncharacterized protein LOC118744952 isoform X1 [Rhagoletis pomonella]XP_036334298.1 uncharacterized protein LOC118744952 isoform X1 [Rhagoletis pomonella]